MVLEVSWGSLWTLSFGLSQFHGHSSWPLVCEVARTLIWEGPKLGDERSQSAMPANCQCDAICQHNLAF